tara:strand:- start:10856 stop:11209 length:354 start_codon:yes stop_codon:yes gene_type:complete
MAQEIVEEKRTVKGSEKPIKAELTVKDRLVLRRANFRFLLAMLILGIYGFTIYSLMYSEINMDDKVSTLLVSVISALTVLISQTGSFYYSDPKSDANDTSDSNNPEEEEEDVRNVSA